MRAQAPDCVAIGVDNGSDRRCIRPKLGFKLSNRTNKHTHDNNHKAAQTHGVRSNDESRELRTDPQQPYPQRLSVVDCLVYADVRAAQHGHGDVAPNQH